MIGTGNVLVNVGGLKMFFKCGADEKVINAPTDTTFASVGAPCPPSVALFFGVEKTEGVDKAGRDDVLDSLALCDGVSGILFVIFGASEIHSGVSGVKITTNDDRLLLLQRFNEF